MKKIVRNLSSAEDRAFWESAESSAAAARKRPERANVGIDFAQAGIVGMVEAVKKSSAASRTVDMFRPPEPEANPEDAQDKPTVVTNESIERASERWRASAMMTQEHVSKHFNDGEPGKAVFRVTQKDNMLFLEQFRHGKDGQAFHWSGVMFKPGDLYELTECLVKAARERKRNGNQG